MLSLNSTMWVVPALIGPGLGAYVAIVFGWRWAFAGLLPLAAVAAVLLLPAVDARPAQERVDVFGALRLLFSRATLRARPGLHASFIAFGLMHASFFGADAYVALMLTTVRGISLQLSSLCITLAVVGWSLAALCAPPLLARFGAAWVVFLGAIACALGAGVLTAVALGAPIPVAFAGSLISGAGIGFGYPTLSAVAFGFAEKGNEGAVSSATLLAGIVGIIVGVLACGASVAYSARGGMSLQSAMVDAFGIAALFGVLLATLYRRLPSRAA
jgi:MFS family permease